MEIVGGLNPSCGSLVLNQHADGVSRSPGGLEPSNSNLVLNQHAYGVVSWNRLPNCVVHSYTLMDQTDAYWLEGIAPIRLYWSCLQLPMAGRVFTPLQLLASSGGERHDLNALDFAREHCDSQQVRHTKCDGALVRPRNVVDDLKISVEPSRGRWNKH